MEVLRRLRKTRSGARMTPTYETQLKALMAERNRRTGEAWRLASDGEGIPAAPALDAAWKWYDGQVQRLMAEWGEG